MINLNELRKITTKETKHEEIKKLKEEIKRLKWARENYAGQIATPRGKCS